MDPPVSRAYDRVFVDVVLPSGVVLADYALDRPVPAMGRSELAPDAELLLTPGASTRLQANRLTVSFDLLPDDVSVDNGRVSVARTRRTVDVQSDEAALGHLLDGLCSELTVESLIGALPPHLQNAARDIVADLIGWGAVVAGTGARARLAHEWSVRGARSRGRLSPSEVADFTFAPRTRDDGDATLIDLARPRDLPIDSLSAVLRRRRSPPVTTARRFRWTNWGSCSVMRAA